MPNPQLAPASPVTQGSALDGTAYRFHRCVRVPSLNKTFYITRPRVNTATHAAWCCFGGLYDSKEGPALSAAKALGQCGHVKSIATWRGGIVACGPEGITHLDVTTYKATRLLSVEIGSSGFRCLSDIAALPFSNTIWFIDTDYRFHDATASKIYCFDPLSGSLDVATTDIEVPVNIAFSAGADRCYISDAGSGSIMAYDVVVAQNGSGYALTNRTRFVYVDSVAPTTSLAVSDDDRVYAACDNRILSWDKTGRPLDQLVLDEPILDFVLREDFMTITQRQRILEVCFRATDIDARL